MRKWTDEEQTFDKVSYHRDISRMFMFEIASF